MQGEGISMERTSKRFETEDGVVYSILEDGIVKMRTEDEHVVYLTLTDLETMIDNADNEAEMETYD